MKHRLTPEETALLTAYLIHRYQLEKGREVTRFRLSRNSVRLLGLRDTLRDAFIEEWAEALESDWGWITFSHGEEFGLIRITAISGWVRIGSKRLAEERAKLKRGDRSVFDQMRGELAAREADDSEEEEQDSQ